MDGYVKDERDLIELAREQANAAYLADKENRDRSAEDTDFVFTDDQWDANVKAERGQRPCLNANDLPVFLDQVSGEARMNKVGIEAKPVDSNADPFKAEVVGGLIRAIEYDSDADVAYYGGLESAAAGAYGAFRVLTEYETEDLFNDDGKLKTSLRRGNSAIEAFNQVMRISPIKNALNVLWDASAERWDRNDGKHVFLYDDITEERFKELYPGKQVIDFDTETESTVGSFEWGDPQHRTIRVAEWFRKEPKGKKKIYLILNDDEDYELTDEPPEDPERIIQEREVEDFKIVWRKISGKEVLEGPVDIPGKLWPIIPVWGKENNVNGKTLRRGMFRYAKDPQRMYIYFQSAVTELLALQPKAPYLVTPRMVEGFENKWRTANTNNWPYLPYNPDDKIPGLKPDRQQPPGIPTGLVEQAAARQAEKKDVIGLHNASLGKRSNETSGAAIAQRKQEGDTTTYTYHDNLHRAIKQCGRVMVGMIPYVYDTPRIIRLLGLDGKEILQPINQPWKDEGDNELPPVDLTIGRYDIVLKAGPGYATQRMEAVDKLTNLMQYAPAIAAVLADPIVDLMDIPKVGDKIVNRLEAMLPPQVRAAENGGGELTVEQVQAAVMQAVEEYKQSLDGQKEAMKVEQERLQVEQERLQTEQARIKLAGEGEGIRALVAELVQAEVGG